MNGQYKVITESGKVYESNMLFYIACNIARAECLTLVSFDTNGTDLYLKAENRAGEVTSIVAAIEQVPEFTFSYIVYHIRENKRYTVENVGFMCEDVVNLLSALKRVNEWNRAEQGWDGTVMTYFIKR